MTGTRPPLTGRAPRKAEGTRLGVDPIACQGIGLCALQAPDVVELDRWGYPVLAERELRGRALAQAGRAVRACPRRALWLETGSHDAR